MFNVDFGDISSVLTSDVRIMKDEFMVLPFQAVECFVKGRAMSNKKLVFFTC